MGLEDGQLLARYELDRDEAAFEALVGRHGPMVLTICRAVLRNEHDVEDAFQATFLVLARKAGSIRGGETLGGWLHRVAYRSSVQASGEAARRRRKEAEAAMTRLDSSGPSVDSEILALLHEEIDRLPEGHRLPVVLCDLEGLSYDQAARQLRWTVPTLRNRLARARQRLKDRLNGRDASASASLAVVPPTLARSTTLAALGGSASAGAAALSQTILRGMLMTRIKFASTAAMAALALASAGVIALGGGRPPGGEPGVATMPEVAATPQAEAPAAPGKPAEVVEIKGQVVAPDGKPIAGAAVRGLSIIRDEATYPKATSGPDGRFSIQIPKPTMSLAGFTSPYPWLVASAPGFGIGWTERVLRDDRPAEQVVTLTPEAPPIEGRIVDLEGRAVVGARVRANAFWYEEKGDFAGWIAKARNGAAGNLWQGLRGFELSKFFPIETTTGADGRFQLLGIGPDRIVELFLSGPAVSTTQVHAFSRPEAEVKGIERGMIRPTPFIVHAPKFEVALTPSKLVQGVARDKDTGRPIAGLLVWAAPFDESSLIPTPGIESTTDAEGRYRLDGLPKAEAYRLFIRPEKGLPYPNATLKAPATTPALEPVPFDFALKRGVIVKGKVTDKVSGRKILGYVNYYAFGDNPNAKDYPGYAQAYDQQAYFGDDGGFEIVAIPGRGLIAVRDEEGRFLPAAGAEKIAGYDPKMKGFRTTHTYLPAGGHALISEVVVDPKGGPMTLDLKADPGHSLTIEVVDPDGKPLGSTTVKGMSENFATMPFPQDSSGFEIHALAPGRPRRVIIQQDDRKLIGTVFLKGDEAGPVTVKLQPWGTLAGRVVDEDGKPLKGMFLRSPGGSENPHPETDDILPGSDWNSGVRAGDDGRFLFEGLVPGLKYSADAQGGAGRSMIGGSLLEGITVNPGEAKDLGDLKIKPRK